METALSFSLKQYDPQNSQNRLIYWNPYLTELASARAMTSPSILPTKLHYVVT
jgi:hypothetical protein